MRFENTVEGIEKRIGRKMTEKELENWGKIDTDKRDRDEAKSAEQKAERDAQNAARPE